MSNEEDNLSILEPTSYCPECGHSYDLCDCEDYQWDYDDWHNDDDALDDLEEQARARDFIYSKYNK